MPHFEFLYGVNESHGGDGWRPIRNPHFEFGDSLTVAHDCFEHHFPDDRGELEFELMATGVAYWVRESYYYREPGITDFAEIYNSIVDQALNFQMNYQKRMLYNLPYFYTWKVDSEAEKVFENILHNCYQYAYRNADQLSYNREMKKDYLKINRQVMSTGIHWLRKGYRYAQNKFPCRWKADQGFYNTQIGVDKAFNDLGELYEGDILHVKYKLSNPENVNIFVTSATVDEYNREIEYERKMYA